MMRRSIKRNAIYNLGGTAGPLLVTLATVPLYLRTIGEARYGILALVWGLLGASAVFDLGLSRAAANGIARLRTASDRARAEVFWTALAVNIAVGILGAVALWLVSAPIFWRVLAIPDELRSETAGMPVWLAACVPLTTATWIMSAALQGRERFLTLNLLRAATAVAFQVVPLVCAMLLGPSLRIILPAIVVTKVATLLAFGVAAFAMVPAGRPMGRRRLAKPLLAYGGWVTVSSLTPPLLVVIDRVVIGGVMGAGFVARYSVPFTVANRVLLLPIALAQALFPRLSEAAADHALRLAGDAARTLCVILTAVCGVGILLARPFLELWVGADFAADAAIVMQIAFLGIWAAGLSSIPMFLLQSQRRPGVVARIHLLEILPYVAAVLIGVHSFGLPGAAAAWSLRAAAEACLLFAASGIALRWRSVFLPGSAVVVASFTIAASGRQEAPLALACAAAIGAVTLAWGFSVDPRLKALARELAPSLFRRGPAGEH